MNTLEIDSRRLRRARTRSLVQLGGLLGRSGLLETFQIELGRDLQKDITMKNNIAALFKGFLVLNELTKSEKTYSLWSQQGLAALAETKMEKHKVLPLSLHLNNGKNCSKNALKNPIPMFAES